MANERKITEIIDQKAFDQFIQLRSELKDSQKEFLDLVKSVKSLNDELGRSGNMEEMAVNIEHAQKASENMAKAQDKVEQSSRRAAKAQEEVVKATIDTVEAMNPSHLRAVQGGLDEQIKRQVQLKAELASVRKEMRETDKAVTGSAQSQRAKTQAIVELAKEEAILRQALQQTNLEVRRQTREQIAAEGSSDQLAARLDQLRGAYRGLNDEQRNNEEIGGKLLSQINQLDEELKGLDGKQGVYNRNVGNYASGQTEVVNIMKSAVPELQALTAAYEQGSTILTGAYSALTTYIKGTEDSALANKAAELSQRANTAATKSSAVALNVSAKATKGASVAMRIFRVALISTGIGAIVVALGSLIAYLTTTQAGMDKVTAVTRPLAGVFNSLLDVVQRMGGALVAAFTNPRKAIDDIMGFLKDRVLPYFQIVGSAFSNAFKLDRKALKEDLKALKDLAVSDAKEVGEAIGKTVADGWKRGVNKDQLIKEIEDLEIESTRSHGALRRQMELSAEAARDSSKTEKERQDAAKEATRILNQLTAEQVAIVNKRIELQELEMDMTEDVTREQKLQLAELEAQREDLEGNAARRRARFTSIENSAAKASTTLADNQAKLEEQYSKERLERIEKATERSVELEQSRANRLAILYKEEAEESNLSLDSRLESLQLFQDKQLEINELQTAERIRQESKRQTAINQLVSQGREEEAEIERQLLKSNLEEIEAIKLEGEAKVAQEVLELQKKLLKENGIEVTNAAIEQARENSRIELEALEESFLNQEISQEKYNERRKELNKELNQDIIQAEIEAVEAIIEANEVLGIDMSAERKKLADLQMRYARSVRDAEIDAMNETLSEEKKVVEARKQLMQELSSLAFHLIQAGLDKQLEALEVETEILNQEKEDKLNAIEQEGLSQEEATQRKAIVEAEARSKERQIEQEKRRVKQKQARADRLANIASIIGNTAAAVAAALPNIPLSILVGGIGAAQLVKVMSTPLPKFWRGTDSSPEGPAIVGERGSELMVGPDGNVSLTPHGDTLTYLQKGTKIFDANKTKQILASASLPKGDREAGTSLDLMKLIQAGEDQTRKLERAFKGGKSQAGTILTDRGIRKYSSRSSNIKNYINRLL